MDHLRQHITEQIRGNRQKNLFNPRARELFEVNGAFRGALQSIVDSREEVAGDLVSYAAQALVEEVLLVNQFVQVSPAKVAEAEAIYAETFQRMRDGGDVEAVLLTEHFPRLAQWLADLYPADVARAIGAEQVLGNVVCEEYSAPFQLRLLGVTTSELMAPVLDIGCGRSGGLVAALRALGVDARGFDRLAEPAPGVSREDWFQADYPRAAHGTVISNAALSNHILYTARHEPARLPEYQALFLRILSSLKPGGTFFYAPSLPFFEAPLSERGDLVVRVVPLAGGFSRTAITRPI